MQRSLLAITLLAMLPQACGSDQDAGTAQHGDVTPPQISSTSPEDGASGVPVNRAISITFSEPLDPTTVNDSTVTVSNGGANVAGAIELDGSVVRFAPSNDLDSQTSHSVTLSVGIRDRHGNALPQAYEFSFATGDAPDLEAPVVVSATPLANSVDVALNSTISITFNEAIDPSSVDHTSVRLSDADGTVAGALTCTDNVISLAPNAELQGQTLHTLALTRDIRDLSGNALAQAFTLSFTTGQALDVTAPTVVATNPIDGAAGVDTNGTISVTFDEPMNPLTLNADTFSVRAGSSQVAGAVTYEGLIATFTPAAPMAHFASHTVTISNEARDLAGNPLSSVYELTFTTVEDTTAPEVVNVSPAQHESAVAAKTIVTITFDEPVEPRSVTAESLIVSDGIADVAGAIDLDGVTVTFTPDEEWTELTEYSVEISTAITDLAGNPLAAPVVVVFRTRLANRIFVTSISGSADLGTWDDAGGNTGLAAADAICQARASAARLNGTFVAWLSGGEDDAYCRAHGLAGTMADNCGLEELPTFAGPWARTDGMAFGSTLGRFVFPEYQTYAPLAFDEYGSFVATGKYFTGTNVHGDLGPNGHCSDWTSKEGGTDGGNVDVMHLSAWGSPGGCSIDARLVCLEAGAGLALQPFETEPSKSGVVFITKYGGSGDMSTWAESGGLAGLEGADAICQAKAQAAGLSGSFKALLSDSMTNALERLETNGPWTTLDGRLVANDIEGLAAEYWPTGINMNELGEYVIGKSAWTGSDSRGGSTADNCGDWKSGDSGDGGTLGMNSYTGAGRLENRTAGCDAAWSLYCIED